MTVISDQADYYLYLDDPRTVTLTSRRQAGDVTHSISYAEKLSTKRAKQVFASTNISSESQVWIIPDALITSSETVKLGDTITAGSDVWTVQDIRRELFDHQWYCLCVKQR